MHWNCAPIAKLDDQIRPVFVFKQPKSNISLLDLQGVKHLLTSVSIQLATTLEWTLAQKTCFYDAFGL